MAAIIILGMHGGGTSLAAAMLHAAGVDMNPSQGYIRRKGGGYRTYEDTDFVRLNVNILHHRGGGWKFPKTDERPLSDSLLERVVNLVRARDKKALWGWKDPRTALTIADYHPHLSDPRYVVVERDRQAIARSLSRRGVRSGNEQRWLKLVDTYCQRIDDFITGVDCPVLHVQYEALLADAEAVRRLVEFAGVTDVEAATARALEMINK